MKRIIALLLSAMLVLSMVGCSKDTKPAVDNQTQSTTNSNVSNDKNESKPADTQTTAAPETTDTPAQVTTEPEITEAPAEATPAVEEVPVVEEVDDGTVSLKKIFAKHGMKAGTCLTGNMTRQDAYSSLILEQFNSATMENSMKPDYIFDKEESIDSGEIVVKFNQDAISMMKWAKENGIALRGHTIVWYSQTPDWIFYDGFKKPNGMVDRDTMLARLESIIKQIFEQLTEMGYADIFYAYDVINEAWMENGTKRANNWTKTIGDDYMWHAFNYAKMYAPENIKLFYNDYNEQYKDETLYNFVQTLVDENGNYIIDGIGLQAHLYTMDDMDRYFQAIEKLGSTGLTLEMTELDVCLGAWQNTLQPTEENLAEQGRYFYNLINGLFERADAGIIKMDSITFWGFCDKLSWRKEASPLLFDKDLNAKPAFWGAAQVREQAGFED